MIWAALLAAIAGYVDAICYLRLGGAFAANMTGNVVVVGMAAAQGDWRRSLWCLSIVFAFLVGALATRLALREHGTPRLSLLIEAGMIAVAATGLLGAAAIPLLAAAMAAQNEAVVHGLVAVNVAFITGDVQQLGEQLVAEIVPPRQPADRKPRIILTVLSSYAVGAAIGTLCGRWHALALLLPAVVLSATALLAAPEKPPATDDDAHQEQQAR